MGLEEYEFKEKPAKESKKNSVRDARSEDHSGYIFSSDGVSVGIARQENTVSAEKESENAPAVEDKVVVAKEPEKVVPAPAPKAEKKPDVKYHIRWGDTLWDLSDSYYKNPWKYPKIANYNHIKNPDLIISGTGILIPSE